MNPVKIKKLLSPFIKMRHGISHSKGGLYIGHNTKIKNPQNITFGKGVNISPFCIIISGGG